MPLTRISVWVGVSTLTPTGILCTTGWEKPSDRLMPSAWAWARYPTPTRFSFFSKPLLPPWIMLASRARMVPDMALAWMLPLVGAQVSVSPSLSTRTSALGFCVRLPSGPLTVITAPRVTSTPLGNWIGFLPTRDISCSLGDDAQHFAAHAVGTGLAIGHPPLGGGDNCHSQAVHYPWKIVGAAIDAQAGLADALDLFDYRAPGIVLELDLQLRLRFAAHRKTVNVTFILQSLGNCHLHLGRRHRDHGLFHGLGIADWGQHVGDGITHTHNVLPYHLALTMPGTSPRMAASRNFMRDKPNLLYTPRDRPVSAQRLRWRVGLALRGNFCRDRRAAIFSSSLALAWPITAFRAARLAAYFCASLTRLISRLIMDSLAIRTSTLEGEFKRGKQGLGLCVALGGRGDGDVHATQRIDLVVLDFGKHDLLTHPHVVVASAVKGLRGHPAEVTYSRHGDSHQAIEELIHARAAQGHLAADRITIAYLEAGNGLARLRHYRLLPGNLLHVADREIHDLFVSHRLAHPHVEGDLFNAGHLHNGLVAELLHQFRHHRFTIKTLQTSHVCLLSVHHLTIGLEDAHLAAILKHFETNPVSLLCARIEQSNIGSIERHFLLDDATRGALERIGLLMFLDPVYPFHHHMPIIQHTQHGAAPALVLTGQHDDLVTLANTRHDKSIWTLPDCQGF